jgi:hypothetical protein
VKRYFFDVVGHERSELDYTGRILPIPEITYDAAELMAFDLVVKREDEAIWWAVSVQRRRAKTLLDPGANVSSVCCVAPLH